ncbi:7,8-didemethyl-8-hydroxy-5-deazariboflavin synthase subunit CofG [Methanolapillus ohkumae]|uniref:7,8-didemethyl-8-hydroxy-5-deazariboflavin synthase n=1 Tax=Methanolapillus ohkumae TaxID=3028298 RepID=A0AA96ZVK8_9EURY|nr:FO synthase [Methanosarcinaceae archaeon Am2]
MSTGMPIITFSKNVFIPVTNVCRNQCAYCGFWRAPDHPGASLLTEEEILPIFQNGVLNGCTEALFTFGEYPETHPFFQKQLNAMGFESIVDYVAHLSELAIDCGILPHTNGGALTRKDLEKLAPLNASMGLMLETTADVPAHKNCPGKDPKVRLDMINNAGILGIPMTTGILVGIGETKADRVDSLEQIAKFHHKYGHIQEVIVQNYSPKPGQNDGNRFGLCPPSKEEMVETICAARKILPADVAVQVAPNLIAPLDLIKYGVSDLGGISPVTKDYINPEAPWPKIEMLQTLLNENGYEFRERLPVYPHFVLKEKYGIRTKPLILKLVDENGYRKGD